MRHLCVLQAQVDGDAVRLAAQAPFLPGHDLTDEGIGIAIAICELAHADAHSGQLPPRGDDAIGIETDNDIPVSAQRFRCDRIGLHVSLPTIGDIRAQRSLNLAKSQDQSTKIREAGHRLREERARLGLNQADFAALGGVSLNTQNRYETGAGAPDLAYLLSLSENGVDLVYVVAGQRIEACLEPREAELLRLTRRMTPVQLGHMSQFLASLPLAD